MRGMDPASVLTANIERRQEAGDPALNVYVAELVNGVVEHRERIDELLSTYSQGWTLDRMPAVDRSILRIGCFEVIWRDDIPDTVAISEALSLAQDLSTGESTSFVNGLLGRLSEMKPRIVAAG